MVFSLTFPQGWYILFLFGLLLWGFFAYHVNATERKRSLRFGIVALAMGIITEMMGIGFNLWSYTGGSWPVILWPSYFIIGSASYLAFIVLQEKR